MHPKKTWRSGCLQAAAGTLLAAALPLSAQPFTRTIADGETVVVGRSSVFAIPVNESLLIELGGELQGRGSVIGVAGLMQNHGQLRAYEGSENSTAVMVSGQLNNALTGRIEVTSLWVQAGGALTSAGGFVVGGFRINPSDPLTTVCAFSRPCPGTGFEIDSGGLIAVLPASPMLNYGDAQMSGTLNNAGVFVSRNSTNTSGGVPYEQVLTVGKDPDFGGGPGQLINTGSFELQARNTLRNFASVSNAGGLLLNGGKVEVLGTGTLTNTGNISVGAGGQLAISGFAGYDILGNRVPSLTSTGNITVTGGELINQSKLDLVAQGAVSPLLSIGSQGSMTQGSGYGDLTLLGGKLLVDGNFIGSSVTIDNFGIHGGGVFVSQGAEMRVDGGIRQTDGTLKVDGTLTGPVQLDGGNLSGIGRINGDVFVGGAGGGLPQQPPNCGNAFFACFRPGNSPGHMDVFGSLTLGSNSVLELEIERDSNGALIWDTVFANSMSFEFGSSIRVLIGAGVPGSAVVDLDLLHCGTTCDFGGAQFEVIGGSGGDFTAGVDGLRFALATAPVPEPGTWALWMLGIAAFTGHRWRQRPSRR